MKLKKTREKILIERKKRETNIIVLADRWGYFEFFFSSKTPASHECDGISFLYTLFTTQANYYGFTLTHNRKWAGNFQNSTQMSKFQSHLTFYNSTILIHIYDILLLNASDSFHTSSN